MAEFFQFARRSDHLDDDERQLLLDLRQSTQDALGFLTGDRNNLEHVLSFAARGAEDQSSDGALYARLVRVLQKVYGWVPEWTEYIDTSKTFQSVLRRLSESSEVSIVTTNYDLTVEQCLISIDKGVSYGFSGSVVHGGEPHYSDTDSTPSRESKFRQHVPVLKLHGSTNWFQQESRDTTLVDDRIWNGQLRRNPDEWEGERILAPIATRRDVFHERNQALLVAPTFFKEEPLPLIRQIWNRAREALSAADRVVFIGYSFPQSDVHMRYFLAGALSQNQQLETTQLVDPRADSVLENLSSGPAALGDLFRQEILPTAQSWTEFPFDF